MELLGRPKPQTRPLPPPAALGGAGVGGGKRVWGGGGGGAAVDRRGKRSKPENRRVGGAGAEKEVSGFTTPFIPHH